MSFQAVGWEDPEYDTFSLQCTDTVGWVTGRASGLYKAECLLVMMT